MLHSFLLPAGVLQLAVSSEGFVTESHIHNNIAGNLGGAFHLQGANVTLRVTSTIIEAYVHVAIAWVSARHPLLTCPCSLQQRGIQRRRQLLDLCSWRAVRLQQCVQGECGQSRV